MEIAIAFLSGILIGGIIEHFVARNPDHYKEWPY